MIIYFNNIELDLQVNDDSYRYRAIRGEHALTLHYSLPEHVEIPVGAYCVFEGQIYTLEKPENFKMHNTRNFEYTLIMDSAQANLGKYKFKDTTSRKLKFTLTAKPHEHLQMLVDNMNLRESGWMLGSYVDAVEKPISYNHAYCIDALNQMADEFETEWEVVGKTINLCKVEYNKEAPLPLSYGRGNGFKPGLGRSNTDDLKPVEILYVQGGDRNIDASKYGSTELLLPKNQTIGYDGQYFSGQEEYDAAKARQYITDEDGFSLRRSDKPLMSQAEDSMDCSHIYPSRVGTITAVNIVDAEKHLYDIIDSGIPADLNYEDYIIDGESLTVIFQDGMLAGKEFDIKYIHAGRRFEIVPQEIDGRKMPDSIFTPFVGQKYAVFGMMMPDAYVCDDNTKTGASWDMFREAVKYLYEHEEQRFSFTGELDGIWAKKDWLNIGGKIKLGGYILFNDDRFHPDGVLIRIIGIKDYINNPHSPIIELSNATVGGSIISDLRKIESEEVVNKELHNEAIRFAQRRYRDAIELGAALERMFTNFSEGIDPAFVRTMQLLVGDERLQLRFVNSKTNPQEVDHAFTYTDATKVFSTPSGIIQHMTLGIDTLSPSHAANEYKFWDMAAYTSPPLDGEGALWLYARCSKTNGTGTFLLSAVERQDTTSDYYFPIGYLNSEYEGTRSFVSLYGYTEITPGQIRVNKVVSSDGTQYLDMLAKRFRIGDANSFLSWNVDRENGLVLKGTVVQSPAGDIDYLGVDRGNYVSGTTYYPGDLVKYTDGNVYKCLQQTNTVPTNTTYWKVMVNKGDKGNTGNTGATGVEGQGYLYAYYPSNSLTPPSAPTTSGTVPSGWFSYPNFSGLRYIYVSQCIKTGGSWGGWTSPTIYSVKGEDGDPGPAIVYRGDFSSGNMYYNNAARRDVVKYSSTYYIYKGSDAVSGGWNSANWENFGAQFDSVATRILLAENANIGGWVIQNERMESQSGGAYLDGKTGTIDVNGSITSKGGKYTTKVANGDFTSQLDTVSSKPYLIRLNTFGGTNYIEGTLELRELDSSSGSMNNYASLKPDELKIAGSSTNYSTGFVVYKLGNNMRVVLNDLPTDGQNLPSGTLWRDGNTIKIA